MERTDRKPRAAASELRVTVVTTGFPPLSGIFVGNMVDHLPPDILVRVLTPCARQDVRWHEGERVRVLCFRYGPRRWQTLAYQPGGLPVVLKRGGWLPVVLVLFLPALFFSVLRASRQADLIHANWSALGAIAGLAGLLTQTPVVTTLRGADVTLAQDSLLWRVLLRTCRLLSRRLVTVGEGLRDQTAELLGVLPATISVIPNGVARAFFEVPSVAPVRPLRLVSVGLLIPRKGIDTILAGLALLDPALEIELTLVGDGYERARLQAIAAQPQLAARVHFAGALEPPEIPAVLARHEVLVLASHSEGRPNVLVEAMAAGRAVVASNIPGVAEIARDGHNALLFPPGDSEALAALLRRLVDEPELVRRLGEAGRATVAGLTWERTGERYADLYREVVTGVPRRCAD